MEFSDFGNSANVTILEKLSLFQVKYNKKLRKPHNNINHLDTKCFGQQFHVNLEKKVYNEIGLATQRNKSLKISSSYICFRFPYYF